MACQHKLLKPTSPLQKCPPAHNLAASASWVETLTKAFTRTVCAQNTHAACCRKVMWMGAFSAVEAANVLTRKARTTLPEASGSQDATLDQASSVSNILSATRPVHAETRYVKGTSSYTWPSSIMGAEVCQAICLFAAILLSNVAKQRFLPTLACHVGLQVSHSANAANGDCDMAFLDRNYEISLSRHTFVVQTLRNHNNDMVRLQCLKRSCNRQDGRLTADGHTNPFPDC